MKSEIGDMPLDAQSERALAIKGKKGRMKIREKVN